MHALLRFSALVDRLNRGLGRWVAWLTLVMVLTGAFNAVARYLGRFVGANLTSNTFVELQWYLFSLVFLLGAPHALQVGAHVRVDVLYGRLSERGKAWIDIVGGVLFLLPFCVFGAWMAKDFVLQSWRVWEVSSDPGGLPRWPLKTVVPIAFALLGLQGVSEIVKRVAFLRGHDPLVLGLREETDGAEGGR